MTLTSTIVGDSAVSKKMHNHIIFLLDSSGSMNYHLQSVKKVFDETLKHLKATTSDDQELYISLYQFDHEIKNPVFNELLATMRKQIGFYARGMTRLRDCLDLAITDHKKLSKKGEDHSFLVYAITDGADNDSRISTSQIKNQISALSDEWTIATLVPSIQDSHTAKMSGIPAGNIQVWDVNSSTGFEEVGKAIASSYSNYSTMRSSGIKSSSNIFSVNTDNLTRSDIRSSLKEVKGSLHHAQKDYVIKDMVENLIGRDFVKGMAYYELSKLELVQPYKEIVIVAKKDGKKFGGNEARQMLGLPNQDTKVKPGDFGDWRIFIQSTSLNRKVKAGTSLFIKD